MRFLITGVTGFAGRTLATQLLADGHEVFGTTRDAATARVRVPLAADHLLTATLDDPERLAEIVRDTRPDGLFHLAFGTQIEFLGLCVRSGGRHDDEALCLRGFCSTSE